MAIRPPTGTHYDAFTVNANGGTVTAPGVEVWKNGVLQAGIAPTAIGGGALAVNASGVCSYQYTRAFAAGDQITDVVHATIDGVRVNGNPRAYYCLTPSSVPSPGEPVGTGADSVTVKVHADSPTNSVPLADADVWVTSDSAGATVVAGTLQTDSAGEATFLLDAGVTYYLWVQKDGANSIRGQSFVAVAD